MEFKAAMRCVRLMLLNRDVDIMLVRARHMMDFKPFKRRSRIRRLAVSLVVPSGAYKLEDGVPVRVVMPSCAHGVSIKPPDAKMVAKSARPALRVLPPGVTPSTMACMDREGVLASMTCSPA